MEYVKQLIKKGNMLTKEGNEIQLFELNDITDENVLNEWASHLREHYCSEEKIDEYRSGTGLTRKDYLLKMKFPDACSGFGPATRSGDFTEILIADYLEFELNYYVPRERYQVKFNKNISTPGSDVIALKKISDAISPRDELVVFEVKAQSSEDGKSLNKLQEAINHSAKDIIRKGETLNAIKQRMIDNGDRQHALIIERFQNKADKPYIEKYGAAAVHSQSTLSKGLLRECSTYGERIWLIAISKKGLMKFIHELYERASIC